MSQKRESRVSIDLISGVVSGIAGNVVSHPLDTVKVRIQNGRGGSTKFLPAVV